MVRLLVRRFDVVMEGFGGKLYARLLGFRDAWRNEYRWKLFVVIAAYLALC